ncbi:hypothetical protein [Pseudonocardia alni]|uniref:hypothetical protein n=1 Tax=Pseudonocardia alni TaxID=33907 RepID=UPI00280BD78C|nr:hypothetical protein [Pseudonocardia alni]
MRIDSDVRVSLFGRRHGLLPEACDPAVLGRLRDEVPVPAAPGSGGITRRQPVIMTGVVADAAKWLTAVADGCDLSSPLSPTEAEISVASRGPQASSPCRTPSFYVGCVATIVLSGNATVTEHAEQDRNHTVDRWRMGPGDVLLQRRWSPLGSADPRPFLHLDAGAEGVVLFRTLENIVASPGLSAWREMLTRAEIAEALAIHRESASMATATAVAPTSGRCGS